MSPTSPALRDRTASFDRRLLLFLTPSVLMVALFVGVPLLSGIWHSLFLWDGRVTRGFVGLDNYLRVLRDARFWQSVGSALALVVANVLKLGITAGVALALHKLRGSPWQRLYLALLLMPLLVPALATLVVWKGFFASHGGLINAVLARLHLKALLVAIFPGSFHAGQDTDWLREPGLVLPSLILWGFPWVSAPGVLLFLVSLRRLPARVYDAAALDCITPAQVFRHVELPALRSVAWLAAAVTAIGTLQGFALQYLLLGPGGPNGVGVTPGLRMFDLAFQDLDFGAACALSVVLTALLAVAGWLVRRFLWTSHPMTFAR